MFKALKPHLLLIAFECITLLEAIARLWNTIHRNVVDIGGYVWLGIALGLCTVLRFIVKPVDTWRKVACAILFTFGFGRLAWLGITNLDAFEIQGYSSFVIFLAIVLCHPLIMRNFQEAKNAAKE